MSNSTPFKFLQRGNDFVVSKGLPKEHEILPPGTYSVKFMQTSPFDGEYYLTVASDNIAPGKLYGDIDARAKHIIKAFLARPGMTTGTLLTGEKGTGKSLLAKRISELLRTQHKVPTILMNEPYKGTKFMEFINGIDQPIMLLCDEADKVFREKNDDEGGNGESLLSLFDGVYSTSHKLAVLVSNVDELSIYLDDRPGRIHYKYKYAGLELSVIEEYANDNLKNKDNMKSLLIAMSLVITRTHDVLKGLIWEMNHFNCKAGEALKRMNISVEHRITCKLEITGHGEFENYGNTMDAFTYNVLERHVRHTAYLDSFVMKKKENEKKIKEESVKRGIRQIEDKFASNIKPYAGKDRPVFVCEQRQLSREHHEGPTDNPFIGRGMKNPSIPQLYSIPMNPSAIMPVNLDAPSFYETDPNGEPTPSEFTLSSFMAFHRGINTESEDKDKPAQEEETSQKETETDSRPYMVNVIMNKEDLIHEDIIGGVFQFENENFTVKLTRKVPENEQADYWF